ncbi:TonB family protein [Stenotrophomonas sp. YIM B06876]|uniref:energy transducer TonB n=1 Tax=Stenotrophomonas sp. YIM B06876 TaxID=3060211 RepID=UPI00273821E1|nr:TonB family protein [Stenotrophomonas sp. YIM B06876]
MNLRLLLCASIVTALLSGCGQSGERAAPAIAPTEVAAVQTPPPDYPIELACTGVGGTTVLNVVVGAEGVPVEVKLLTSSGNAKLDESAQSRVREWKFNPATRNGKGVNATIQVPVSFNPPQPKPDKCFAIQEHMDHGD